MLPCAREGADLSSTDPLFKLLTFTGSPSLVKSLSSLSSSRAWVYCLPMGVLSKGSCIAAAAKVRTQGPGYCLMPTNLPREGPPTSAFTPAIHSMQGWDMKARAGKKAVVLELGGNAAAVIEDYRGDRELAAIIPKLTFGAFYQSGQSCISLQRLFVRQARTLWISRCHLCTVLS